MERKTLWKNFLVLAVGGLLALHVNVSSASEESSNDTTDPTSSDECVLTVE